METQFLLLLCVRDLQCAAGLERSSSNGELFRLAILRPSLHRADWLYLFWVVLRRLVPVCCLSSRDVCEGRQGFFQWSAVAILRSSGLRPGLVPFCLEPTLMWDG